MILDRKGDIGFPEAMVGTATVCIVLTIFLSHAVTVMSADSGDGAPVAWDRLSSLSIESGEYAVDADIAEDFRADLSCSGIRITLDPNGVSGISPWSAECGDLTGDCRVHARLINAESDDGRSVPTVAEVTVFS